MARLSSALWLSLLPSVLSSPLINNNFARQAPANASAILKSETLAAIQNVTASLGIPGAIIAITSPQGDGVLTFGNRTVDGDPVTPDTHFAIASNSKLFLGTVLAWLHENGTKLENGNTWTLDMPLKDFVPDFRMVNDNATQLATTRDFLSHRTGLPAHDLSINPSDTPKTWMNRLANLRPNTDFRSIFTYSNVNYAASTYIVELLTGKSYYDVLEEVIFRPLGMDASSDYAALKDSGAEISQGWFRQGINATACRLEAQSNPEAANTSPVCLGNPEAFEFWTDGSGQEWGGGGNVIATGNDLVKWSKEVLNPTHIPASVFEMVETPSFQGTDGYGFGTVQQDYRGYNASLHDGALPGSHSLFIRVRNESIGVFALATDDTLGVFWYQTIYPLILDDLLGLEPEQPDDSASGEGSDLGGALPSTPLPTEPRASPDVSSFVDATFSAPGYQRFTLRSINLADPDATRVSEIPIQYLTTDFASLAPVDFTSERILYTPWGQTIGQFLFFTHFDGPLYNVTAVLSQARLPRGTRSSVMDNGFIGKYGGGGTAVLTEDGIGFFNGFWGKAATVGNRPPVEENVEASAEVFFRRRGNGDDSGAITLKVPNAILLGWFSLVLHLIFVL